VLHYNFIDDYSIRFETKYSITDHSIIVGDIIKKKGYTYNSIYEFPWNNYFEKQKVTLSNVRITSFMFY